MASFGILAVLLALAACAVWGAAMTYRADVAVKRATMASDAIEQVKRGIVAERQLHRGASAAPGEDARARHRDASATIQSNLQTAHVFTESTDRRLVDDLLARYLQYSRSLGSSWGEVSDDSAPLRVFDPLLTDGARSDAALSTLEADADQVAERLRVEALGLLQLLVTIQTRVFVGGPALFALGLLLVGAIWRMQRSEQRRGMTRLMQDAYAANREERRFRGVVHGAPDPMLICAGPGNVIYHNAAAEEAWSLHASQLEGQSILMLAHPEDRAALRAWWEQLRPAGSGGSGEVTRTIELRLRDGLGAWRTIELVGTNLLEDATVQGIVLSIRTAERRIDPDQQAELVLLDPLTRLPNSVLLRDRLGQAMARAGRRTDKVGVLMIALDGLPTGPASAVDPLVLGASMRIQSCVRPQDTVARLDTATFAVVRELVGDESDIVSVAESLSAQFSRPLAGVGGEVVLLPRIGVVVGNPLQDTVDGLLRNAGLAMQQVMPEGVQRHALFQSGVRSEALDRLELEGDLRGAVQRLMRGGGVFDGPEGAGDKTAQEIWVHYQPIVSFQTGKACGFEALVRWQHPLHGMVPSRDLIPMAEETGLIVPLGQWVLEEACRQLVRWHGRFGVEPPLTLGVNLSSVQFRRPDLVAEVTRALSEAGLAPGCLRLEVTEATIMRDADHAVKTLWSLKTLGVQLAIDDFGAGYSALPYLKQLPIGLLKIDGAFISGMGHNQEDTATVRAVMSLAKSLGWGVTAEGIETAAQAQLLVEWGCDFGQGYHFGRPLDETRAGEYLAAALAGPGPAGRVRLAVVQ